MCQVPTLVRTLFGTMGDNVVNARRQTQKWMEKVRDRELSLRTTVEMVAELVEGLDGAEKGRAFTASERNRERRIQRTVMCELLDTEPATAAYYRDYAGVCGHDGNNWGCRLQYWRPCHSLRPCPCHFLCLRY